DALALRQANAAVTLLHLGDEEGVWDLLRHGPDPSRRTYLTHHLGPYGIPVRVGLERLQKETDVSARRAPVLGRGGEGPEAGAVALGEGASGACGPGLPGRPRPGDSRDYRVAAAAVERGREVAGAAQP